MSIDETHKSLVIMRFQVFRRVPSKNRWNPNASTIEKDEENSAKKTENSPVSWLGLPMPIVSSFSKVDGARR